MEEINWFFWSKYRDRPIQDGKTKLPYWVYTKHFICKYLYIEAADGQTVSFVTTKVTAVTTNKIISSKIAPHISYALRDLGVIFDKYILSRSTILAGVDRAGTA